MLSRPTHRPFSTSDTARTSISPIALATVCEGGHHGGARSSSRCSCCFSRNYQPPYVFIPQKSSASQCFGGDETARRSVLSPLFRRVSGEIARTRVLVA